MATSVRNAPWPARQWTGSVENGWREVYEIDPGHRLGAAEKLESLGPFLRRCGHEGKKETSSDLRRPERNVRMHTDKQLKEFRRSVEMFGRDPVHRGRRGGRDPGRQRPVKILHGTHRS